MYIIEIPHQTKPYAYRCIDVIQFYDYVSDVHGLDIGELTTIGEELEKHGKDKSSEEYKYYSSMLDYHRENEELTFLHSSELAILSDDIFEEAHEENLLESIKDAMSSMFNHVVVIEDDEVTEYLEVVKVGHDALVKCYELNQNQDYFLGVNKFTKIYIT